MYFGDLLTAFLGMLQAIPFRDVCSTLIAVAAAVTTIMVAANNILDFIAKLNSLLAPKKQKKLRHRNFRRRNH